MERIDSLLMLDYMVSEGFNPSNYERVLELSQSAPNSISKDLVHFCNQYLLSKEVRYPELEAYGIDGAFGYVENNNICVPHSKYNDNHFLHTAGNRLYQKHNYGIPSMDEFGAIISYEDRIGDGNFASVLTNTLGMEEKFFGFIKQKESYTKNEKFFIERCVGIMNQKSPYTYVLAHDIISEKNKEVYLIKRKK